MRLLCKLGVHCMHVVDEMKKDILDKGHGRYAQSSTSTALLMKKICCHCGKEKVTERVSEFADCGWSGPGTG